MRLSDLKTGETARVRRVLGHGAFRKRMLEMGFVRGREVRVLLHAPLHDPIKYMLMGYEVALRASEAQMVEVEDIDDPDDLLEPAETYGTSASQETWDDAQAQPQASTASRPRGSRPQIKVAFVGNPNCGKTSLFNAASGAREHVGNYSGVTVDAKYGHLQYGGYDFQIVDLPGTYSLSSYTPEEQYVRQYLRDETPDVIVNVVDASNLERNLYLTTQLIDMDRSMVIALNMYDELESSGAELDYQGLAGMIGVPIVPTAARNGTGIDKLFDTIIEVHEGRNPFVRHIHVNLGHDLEGAVKALTRRLKAEADLDRHFSPRFLAIKLLEHDSGAEQIVRQAPGAAAIFALRDELVTRLTHLSAEDIASAIANQKYGFIAGALAEMMPNAGDTSHDTTRIIDSFVTNKLFGFPLFFLVMFAIFWATFALGQYPMDWLEQGVAWLSTAMQRVLPEGALKDLVCDGIIGGVGSVIVFLPNILILYFCISFMEDSGYMARAAFIMDKVMHRIGLHGKSFIPLVMGFGCNVPAIMGARAIESRSSRIITILINPFMSCSARLPIYVLLIGTFFTPGQAPLVFIGLYLLGIAVAVLTAKLIRRFAYKKDETPFVMELPPYRVPTLKALLRHTWGKGEQYLKKMGGIILVACVIVWFLDYYPQPTEQTDGVEQPSTDSYLRMVGKAITPVMEPLGLNWQATVAALAGVPAKEIVVSTLGVLYTNDEATSEQELAARLRAPSPVTGAPGFTTASALAFMIFILLYCPCIATITAISRECGSWRYGAFSALYNTTVAWVVAWVAYRLCLLL